MNQHLTHPYELPHKLQKPSGPRPEHGLLVKRFSFTVKYVRSILWASSMHYAAMKQNAKRYRISNIVFYQHPSLNYIP